MAEHRSLLVVEDLGLVDHLTQALTHAGWTVRACTSAREAIHIAKHRDIDDLLIAATLPDERGDVVFYRLAAMHPHLRTHTVFLTRSGQDQEVVEVTQRTALQIPVTTDQVLRTMSEFYGLPTAS
jgi:DNA-binding response OmpR family regulator